jgi:hypothetical protein
VTVAIIADDKVLSWRRDRLLDAGFPYDHAHSLAVDSAVDLHEACDLARLAGHWLAWRLLATQAADDALGRSTALARIEEYT